ncbi:hypothetical protein [Sutcliffiella deserti]|uniref:hypothetical protein n=1 Tax=Sutcliffiella deserti TaxID=2875501 RepID=UPI001CC12148|nr:hypothetical protein [Sutcliffiella deserti]
MKQVSLELFNWIQEETDSLEGEWRGSQVSHIIPKRYTHYCKILHPMQRDIQIKDETLLWRDGEPPLELNPREKIRYQELCRKYGFNYTKEISTHSFTSMPGGLPRYLIAPEEGFIPIEDADVLARELEKYTSGMVYYYFTYMKGQAFWKNGAVEDLLYEGDLDEVLDFYDSPVVHGKTNLLVER